MKIFPILALLLILTLGSFALAASIKVHGVGTTVSIVSISPVHTCCGTTNVPYRAGDGFTIDVILDLASGQSINGFDVRLNYSNPRTNSNPGTLQAQQNGIVYSNNLFGSQGTVAVECIDGIVVHGNCPNEDIGQVHLAEVVIGNTVSGPQSGLLLFRVSFSVTGNGNSTFVPDRTNFSNPNPDPSNSQLLRPYYIPVLATAGVFGNTGVVAFFNYQPADTSITGALLPNQPVLFDASPSFVPSNSSMLIQSYSWNFGDGTPGVTGPNPAHTFTQPGNYTVTLTVFDSKNNHGVLARRLNVVPALGSILLTVLDQMGTVHRGDIMVRVFNSSLSINPFKSKLIDNAGNVQFSGLSPGNYYLTFSGANVENSSKTEPVSAGLTKFDSIYLTTKSPVSDNSGLVYIGTILGGLGIVTAAIIYNKRGSLRKSRDYNRVKSRKSR